MEKGGSEAKLYGSKSQPDHLLYLSLRLGVCVCVGGDYISTPRPSPQMKHCWGG